MANMKNTKKFFNDIILSTNPASSKRFVTLMAVLHFFLASFVMLFVVVFVIFKLPKGKVDNDLLTILKDILEYDFYIIGSGLGFITIEGVTNMFFNKAKNIPKQTTTPDNTKNTQEAG